MKILMIEIFQVNDTFTLYVHTCTFTYLNEKKVVKSKTEWSVEKRREVSKKEQGKKGKGVGWGTKRTSYVN